MHLEIQYTHKRETVPFKGLVVDMHGFVYMYTTPCENIYQRANRNTVVAMLNPKFRTKIIREALEHPWFESMYALSCDDREPERVRYVISLKNREIALANKGYFHGQHPHGSKLVEMLDAIWNECVDL